MFTTRIAAVVACCAVPVSAAMPVTDALNVSLDRAVHFASASGPQVSVGPGEVSVDFAGAALGLTVRDQRVVVQAQWSEHDAALEAAMALAIPDEANPDLCHLVLLLPGGTLLESIGSYSGVQQRGILDKVKQSKVSEAAKQAGARIKETASNVQETAHGVGETVQAKVQQTSAAVLDALPAGPLKDLIRGMDELGVQQLLECMATTDRGGPGLSKLIGDFGADPTAFFQGLGDEVAGRLESRLDGLLKRDLEKLRKGGPPPTVEEIVDESLDTLVQVLKERPATRCLMTYIEPRLPTLKVGILSMAERATARQQQFLEEKVMPLLFEKASELLVDMILEESGRRIPVASRDVGAVQERGVVRDTWEHVWKWQDRNMASGLWTESISEQLVVATGELETALKTHDAEKARNALVTLEAWADNSALKYGIDIIRYKGHQALYKLDGRLYVLNEKVFEWMGVSIMVGDESVDAVAGLIPEVGAAVKTFCDAPLKTLWNLLGRRIVITTAKKAIHAAWEGVCLGAEAALIHGKDSADPGPLAAAMGALSRDVVLGVAEKALPDTKQRLEAYNDQLRILISEWEDGG